MKKLTTMLVAGLATVGLAMTASAEYPEKPITFVIPYSAGGSSDTLVRGMQPFLEKALGATIVPKNVTGGGGAVGMSQALFSSRNDGYTVTLPSNAVFGLQGLGNVPWKYTDFDTVARIITEDYSITVRADAPWKTLKEFIEYSKAHPGEVKMGFSGFGSSTHIVAAAFAQHFGLDFKFVPYKGGAKTVAATMGGHIDVNTHHPAETKAGVDAGKMRVLAVMGAKRSNLYPDVPTMKELGYDWEMYQWRGVAMPKGVPAEVKDKWAKAMMEIAKNAEFEKFIVERMGGTVAPLVGADLDKFIEHMASVFVTTAEGLKASKK